MNQVAMPEKKPQSGLALASLICGVLSLVFLGILTAIPAVICGHMGLNQLKREPDAYDPSGRGMAIAGLVMGYLTIAITALVIIFIVVAISAGVFNNLR